MLRSVEELRKLAVEAMAAPRMTPASIHEINAALAEVERTANADGHDKDEAAAAFESDMAPICEAVATAIRTKDRAAFEGLKAMFAPMLIEANAEPALAQAMQRQIGAALLSSFAEPTPGQGGLTS